MKNIIAVFLFILFGKILFSQNNVNVLFCRLNISINPGTSGIKADVLTIFKSNKNISQLEFSFSDSLTIDSILYHTSNQNFLREKNKLTLLFNPPIDSNKVDSVLIYYSGEPKNNLSPKSFNRGLHDSVPTVWTQSEPYGAGDWWPAIDNLSDKIDSIDIIVQTPAKYRSASNGLLISDEINNNERVSFWKHRYPIATYLVGIAITNYLQYNDTAVLNSDTLIIMNYVFPEYFEIYQQNSFATALMLNYYSTNFAPYPFIKEKYGHAMIPGWGGMEHQTITFISSYDYMLVSHEAAHHWFGNLITCSSWKDIWLNEGFATYLSNMPIDFEPPPNDFYYWKKSSVESITKLPDGSVWVDDTTSVARIFDGRLSYGKGAFVLHLLRHKMGKNNFFQAIRNYLNDQNLKYSFANTQKFMQHVRNIDNSINQNFETQWIYGQGHPIFETDCYTDANGVILLSIAQKSSHNSIELFYCDLEVRFFNNYQDTIINFEINNIDELFKFQIDFQPDSIEINPNYNLITPNSKQIAKPLDNEIAIITLPNPTKNLFSIYSKNIHFTRVDLYNSYAQLIGIYENEFINIDISKLNAGIYLLKIFNNDKIIKNLRILKINE